MTPLPPPPHAPLEWVGSALDELMEFPSPVRRQIGYALRFAQAGAKTEAAKPLKGFKGAGVLEIVEAHQGDAYRAVYTLKFGGVVYVLLCFQKKSTKGIATPKHIIDLIHQRLAVAEQAHQNRSATL